MIQGLPVRRSPVVLPAQLVLISILAGAGAMAGTARAAPPDALRCEIRSDAGPAGVSLTGVVSARVAAEGRSRLSVAKAGPAGSSTVNQNGQVRLAPGESIDLGSIAIGLEPGSHAHVELQVHTRDGLECRAAARLGD